MIIMCHGFEDFLWAVNRLRVEILEQWRVRRGVLWEVCQLGL